MQVEFVSANPTGPLHVGHGRGAALGASIANLLDATGFEVQREYYVNDAGRQMDILAASVWLRYLELARRDDRVPARTAIRGDYVRGIAASLQEAHGEAFRARRRRGVRGAAARRGRGRRQGAPHRRPDRTHARAAGGENGYRTVFDTGLDAILADIQGDLGEFGVRYDEWFSERSLAAGIPAVVERLAARPVTSTRRTACAGSARRAFGDDKDRVVVRANGQSTYFASDIAYVTNKLERGFDRVLYVFGADHHGYVARLKAACEALGFDPERLEFLLIQFAILYPRRRARADVHPLGLLRDDPRAARRGRAGCRALLLRDAQALPAPRLRPRPRGARSRTTIPSTTCSTRTRASAASSASSASAGSPSIGKAGSAALGG